MRAQGGRGARHRGHGVRECGKGPYPFGATEAFGALHRATRRSRVARSVSRRGTHPVVHKPHAMPEAERGLVTARNDGAPPFAVALRPGALPTTGGTNQVHQMFHAKHPYWFPCLAHISDKPSCSVSAQFSPKCCGFAARGSAQGDETKDDLGKRSLSGKARGLRGPHPQHLGENRTSGRTWMADAASASHSVVRRPRRPPSDRRMFHVKHSFVAWGGCSPRAPPERGAASATRCGPGSLSFGRTSDGRTRLRAYLAPR